MPNIRIKDIPTTASATSSTDFIGIDGSANGTRKLNAFSPTFGGNLTVSGTATIGSSADVKLARGPSGAGNLAVTEATDGYCEITARGAAGNLRIFSSYTGGNFNWYWGADASAQTGSNAGSNFVLVAGSDTGSSLGSYLTVNRATAATTLTGNLTVSGGTITGGTSGLSLASGGTNQSITLTPSGTGRSNAYGSIPSSAWAANDLDSSFNAGLVVGPRGTGSSFGVSTASASPGYPSGLLVDGSYAAPNSTVNIKAVGVYSGGGYGASLAFHTSSNTTLSEVGRFTKAGNLLLKSDGIDSGNGKLQLAENTARTAGIGFGTDIALYRAGGNTLKLELGVSAAALWFDNGGLGTGGARILGSSGAITVTSNGANSVYLQTGGTTALTLDSSQNATFAGDIRFSSANAFDIGQTGTRVRNAFIRTLVLTSNAPAAANSTGTAGTVTWDTDYIYVCTATDTWKRVAIATW